jgi:hypothetical protein
MPPFNPPEKRYFAATLVPPIDALFDINAAITHTAQEHFAPDVDYRHTLRYSERVVRGGAWCITATNPHVPTYCDEHGMPDRPDMFFAGQIVEMDMVFFAYDKTGFRGVGAHLKGLRLVGGVIRSIN